MEKSSRVSRRTEDEEERDPMADLDIEGSSSGSPSKDKRITSGEGAKRRRYYMSHSCKELFVVQVPERCLEQDPTCTDMRKVTLYMCDWKT